MKNREIMEMKNKNGGSFFQMPLHYPRYTKKDYENMPEWQLDRLLEAYGLPIFGDLNYKRSFAMGAFLWPDSGTQHNESRNSSSACNTCGLEHDSSPCSYKKCRIVALLFRVLGYP